MMFPGLVGTKKGPDWSLRQISILEKIGRMSLLFASSAFPFWQALDLCPPKLKWNQKRCPWVMPVWWRLGTQKVGLKVTPPISYDLSFSLSLSFSLGKDWDVSTIPSSYQPPKNYSISAPGRSYLEDRLVIGKNKPLKDRFVGPLPNSQTLYPSGKLT